MPTLPKRKTSTKSERSLLLSRLNKVVSLMSIDEFTTIVTDLEARFRSPTHTKGRGRGD